MHDLVPDIDGWTVLLDRTLYDFDGTHDTRTKSAGLR
jgi:hypothetical protein